MSSLLCKKQTFVWGSEQEETFRVIKERLVSALVLYCPHFSGPFVVQTDASDFEIGAMLTQEYWDGEHVISYRSTEKSEEVYSEETGQLMAVPLDRPR